MRLTPAINNPFSALAAIGLFAFSLTSAAQSNHHSPDSVTLVLGDQSRHLRSLVEASGVLDDVPYHFRWANFQGAAPLFEAQRAGSVDTSYAGDLPVLMGAAGGVDLTIVATNEGLGSSNGILVQADSEIRDVADLKGRTVVVSSARGSISQHLLYAALEEAGIERSDVDVRFVLPTDASSAFNSGQIEAWATFDPYLGIAERQGARVLRDSEGLREALSFVTVTTSSLNDPNKRAALADVTQRFIDARQWALENPQQYASVYAQLTGLELDDAAWIAARSSQGMRPVQESDIQALQNVADLFSELEILPTHVNAAGITDLDFLSSFEQAHVEVAP
ncbi:ABC transporter substrate-binding protein [Vreelandella nigrificans]|uniref:Putative aliphatic sulfonates-binding protein n=1 Tax=Vreelandella nigrificans TaxID=2042704 RepID=A0A2A4HJH9_9GAMM|nr:ABC transporter substrate-binding protein [Halomonas nigrificans]PCF95538.1 nitrate ABC transporter substrate-binding protein [Halomonas nigrificans]